MVDGDAKMASMKNTHTRVTVRVRKQGGGIVSGIANARKGSQLRICYIISNGEGRERWFGKSRYEVVGGNVDELPRYVAASCKGAKLPEPVLSSEFNSERCTKCGEHHKTRSETRYIPLTEGDLDEAHASHLALCAEYGYTPKSRENYTHGMLVDGVRCRSEYWVLSTASRKLEDVLAS